MNDLPSGTVTFLFTDIEGSTQLLQRVGDHYGALLAEHRELLRDAFTRNDGREVGTEGDSFFVAFASARAAVQAAVDGQLGLEKHAWSDGERIRVRMGIHTGEAKVVGDDYVGLAVHHAARVSSAAHGGQILISSATRALVNDISLRDLGEFRLKDIARTERLFQVTHPGLRDDFPAPRSIGTRNHNLPAQLTTLIGREDDVRAVLKALDGSRLLTLTGAGGCGKTRLALEVAAETLDDYADGVWLVDLAPLTDPETIPQAVATALGLREQEGIPIESQLEDFVSVKDVLLVLDNCEHLVTACSVIAERLLRASSSLRIIATSREGLGVAGETAWRVPSLRTPEPSADVPPDDLASYESVRLFTERASIDAVEPDDLIAIGHITHRLDGIPLAIELAAARTEVLSPKQIADRLDDRFRLLTGGARTALGRQQTLRALVDWSYELLDADEKQLLERTSVFAGGFSVEAAEAINDHPATLDVLSNLVRKSLIVGERTPDGMRYRLLETIRQYAREKLLASPDASEVRERHARFFFDFAENASTELLGGNQARSLALIDRDHENLRAAFEWSLSDTSSDVALRFVAALWRFWWIRGHWTEGRTWARQALSSAGREPRLVARAHWADGFLAAFQADYASAYRASELAVEAAHEAGDANCEGYALWTVAWANNNVGKKDEAIETYERALAIARRGEDDQLLAWCLLGLGSAIWTDDIDQIEPMQLEALDVAERAEDTWDIAMALNNLGGIAVQRGDIEASRNHHERALALRRELGDRYGLGQTHYNLALLASLAGDQLGFRSHVEESLAIWRDLGRADWVGALTNVLAWTMHLDGHDEEALPFADEAIEVLRIRAVDHRSALGEALHTRGEIHRALHHGRRAQIDFGEALEIATSIESYELVRACLEGLAGLAAADGEGERAAYLSGAASVMPERADDPDGRQRALIERDNAAIRGSLPPDEFEAAYSRGAAAPIEESIRYALGKDDS